METEWMNEAPAETSGTPESGEPEKKRRFSLKNWDSRKKKRWLKILIPLAVVIAIVAGCVSSLTKNVNSQLSGSIHSLILIKSPSMLFLIKNEQ